MNVKTCVCLVILVCLCSEGIRSVAWGDEGAAPKLRYGFQADREYPYQIEIHAKVVDEKIDRTGELIYKVLSANDEQAVLRTSGSAVGQLASLGLMSFPRFGPPRFMRIGAEGITLSRLGAVIVSGPLTHLPMLLGDLETQVFDEFPADAKASWEKQRDVLIEEHESLGGRFGSPFGRGPFSGSIATTDHTAKEVTQFSIAQTRDDVVRITKKYSLKSSPNDKKIKFEMTGAGETEFDRKEGVAKKWSMTYEVKINESGISLTIPISVSARLFAAAEWAERKKKQELAAKAAAAEAAEAARPKPFKAGERKQLLEQLASADDGKVIAAADRLSKAIRDDNPDDFARPLALALSNPNAWVQAAAARALTVWATAAAEDALIKLVKVNNFMYCPPAIEALARVKTENAAEAVAAQMPRYRGQAGKALKEMGPVAEAATISLLKNNDFWMRRETVGVLAEIGGEDAVQALQELAKPLSEFDSRDIRQAINTIQRRLATLPKGETSTARQAAKKAAAPAAKKASETAAQGPRHWRDASGKFEIEATLVGVKDKIVTLRKKDGRTIRVPLKKLSDDDKKFIEEQSQAAFGDEGSGG